MTRRHHDIIDSLDSDTLIITANNRLALELIEHYAKAKNQSVLEKPKCLPYRVFLQELFYADCKTKASPPILLSDQQVRFLWLKILKESQGLNPNQGLIDAVMDAYKRGQQACLSYDSLAFSQNPQTETFKLWVQQFEQNLKALNAITEYHIVPHLLPSRQSTLKKCLWYCFDDYTEEQRLLQRKLSDEGIEQRFIDLESFDSTASLFAANDDEDEWKQIILWLQKQLDSGKEKIGLVVPNLEQEAALISRLLKQQLPEDSYSISLGKPLNTYPLVSHALAFLELDETCISSQKRHLLLHSPYLKNAKDFLLKRAQFLQESKVMEVEDLPLKRFIEALKDYDLDLALTLENLGNFEESASPNDWVKMFRTRLQKLGFPGEYLLNSYSYQGYQRLLLTFDAFCELQFLSESLTKEEALLHLKVLTKATIFQPKIKPRPIKILGLLEASGCLFDVLWVKGLTDQCLPQKTKLTPFIPFTLQKEFNLPHANSEKEYYLAEKQLFRFKKAATDLVFSYPKLTEDKPNLPSPLLSSSNLYEKRTLQSESKTDLEPFEDDFKIAIEATEMIRPTTSLIANQAKCPFKAFGTHRLGAKKELMLSLGLNSQTRGEILHKTMELLMLQIKDQKALLTLTPDSLDNLIQTSIHQALKPYQNKNPEALPPSLELIEKKRLKRLIHAQLDWEKKRTPFKVEALEKEIRLTLANQEFHLRVDRLDKIDNGDQWVIDYKSSLPEKLPWHEERPREPQLLLYALIDESIKTLVFNALKNGQLQCKGLSSAPNDSEGITTLKNPKTWEDEKAVWQEKLEHLTHEFFDGLCEPNPISASVCTTCDLKALCRFSKV